MIQVKRFLWTVSLGALAGGILLAWISPHILVWYFSPPTDLTLSCSPAVQWAIESYRKVMFTGVLLGAIVSTILFFAFNSRRPKKAAVVVDSVRDPGAER
jgi:hypothetical protein